MLLYDDNDKSDNQYMNLEGKADIRLSTCWDNESRSRATPLTAFT